MRIEEVITETIIAIYQDRTAAAYLRLKGGSAMRLFDDLKSRLSTDADFSISKGIENKKDFFSGIKSSIARRFQKVGFNIIDFKCERRPRSRRADLPVWWGGWQCEFKLVAFEHRGKSIETMRRNAMVPEGAGSPKILLEISEYEYCGKKRVKTIQRVRIAGYSRELLVLEKMRAICQQHSDYKYRLSKNRARLL
ncbi:MAG: nucleotidyl transferase AbiEii/AbiGii toxin family protein [bacterium]